MPIDDRAGRSSESSDPERLNSHDEAPYLAPDAPPPAEKPTFLRQTAHYAGLVLAAMIGTLIRLGLDALMDCELEFCALQLTTDDGKVIFPLAWVQGVGCGIMGLGNARKNQIIWIYPPLATFITTGIAGSVTTFSSWMLEGYEAFSNFDNFPRGGLYDTIDGLAYSFATFAISMACISLGEFVSACLPRLPRPRRRVRKAALAKRSEGPSGESTPVADASMIALACVTYAMALVVYFCAPKPWRHRAVFPLLLAPPGAMLRYALSKLNTRSPFQNRFPIGTFAANIAATLIVGGVFAAQRRPGVGTTRCDALYALQQGFCGCLSTVSTFAVEARSIRGKRWKLLYVLGSVILGHVLMLGVVGGVGWTQGYVSACSGSD